MTVLAGKTRTFRAHAAIAAALLAAGLVSAWTGQATASPPRTAASTPVTAGPGTRGPAGSNPWIVYDPAAYNRAVKSKDWVHTPDGLAYKTCVLYAPDHSTVTNGEIILPSGARQQIKPCTHPTLADPRAGKPAQAKAAAPASGPCVFSGPDFWADSCWLSPAPLGFFDESYGVPANPAQSGALIFLYGGLAAGSGTNLLMDALTWGANPGIVSNPNIWYITPWYIFNGTSVHGSSVHVGAGDTINANLIEHACNSGACNWSLTATDDNTLGQSQFQVTSGVSHPGLLGGVMEVPTAAGCIETPASGHAAFRSLEVMDANGNNLTPGPFGINFPNRQCSVTETASSSGADILWAP